MTTVLIVIGLVWLTFGLGFCCGAIWNQIMTANTVSGDQSLTAPERGLTRA